MAETYEDLRKDPSLPQDIRAEWVAADSAEQRYRDNSDKIASDPDLTEEARKRKLLDLYADVGPALSERKRALRQSVLKAAQQAEKASWPRPRGMSLEPGDSSELIAAQNAEAALVSDYRELKKKADQNKLPFVPDSVDYLRDRYRQGLEAGGIAGAAQIRGVIGAAKRLGVNVEEIIAPLRSQREVEALGKAQRLLVMSDVIGTQVNPHRSVQRNRRRPGRINERRGWGAAVLMPGGGEAMTAKAPTHTGTKRRARGKKK